MALKELLIRFKAAEYLRNRREEEQKVEISTEPLQEAWERAGHYFHTLFKEKVDDFDPGFRDKVKEDLSTLTAYLQKASQSKEEKPEERIKCYSIFLTHGDQMSADKAKRMLTDYFGPGKVQRYCSMNDPETLVFPELAILQKEGSKREWTFGRNNLVIMEDQTAYRKIDFDRIELAVFRPHEIRTDFSLYLYEYSRYDFGHESAQIRRAQSR